MTKKIGAIVLSRIDSSRLPGKALKKVKNKVLIEYVLERALNVNEICDVTVATSYRKIDDPIALYCKQRKIRVFRGTCDDVALRFLECMKQNNLDAALRVNGDSPLHSHLLMSQAVEMYKSEKIDLITNVFPRSYPVGMTVELVSRDALDKAYKKMKKDSNFEHVTEYFYENSRDFNIKTIDEYNYDHSGIQLAVDSEDDFKRFKWIINKLGKSYLSASYEKIIDLYKLYEK